MRCLNITEIKEACNSGMEVSWHPKYTRYTEGIIVFILSVIRSSESYKVEYRQSDGTSGKISIDDEGYGATSCKPVFVSLEELNKLYCPRCSNGFMSRWPRNKVCERCGFPGLKSIEEAPF